MLKKTILLMVAFIMLFLIGMPSTASGVEKNYAGHWAEETIQSWLDNEYVTGYPDGSFNPEGLVTRAEFVKMVNNLFGYTEIANISFADVKQDDWYYQDVQKAFNIGYITGVSETQFAPNDNLTREQAAVIVSKIMKLEINPTVTEIFTDSNKVSSWAKDYVMAAAKAQLIKGNK